MNERMVSMKQQQTTNSIPFSHSFFWIPKEGFWDDRYVGFVISSSSESNGITDDMHELSHEEVEDLIKQTKHMMHDPEALSRINVADNESLQRLEDFLLKREEKHMPIYGKLGITLSSEPVDGACMQWRYREWKECKL